MARNAWALFRFRKCSEVFEQFRRHPVAPGGTGAQRHHLRRSARYTRCSRAAMVTAAVRVGASSSARICLTRPETLWGDEEGIAELGGGPVFEPLAQHLDFARRQAAADTRTGTSADQVHRPGRRDHLRQPHPAARSPGGAQAPRPDGAGRDDRGDGRFRASLPDRRPVAVDDRRLAGRRDLPTAAGAARRGDRVSPASRSGVPTNRPQRLRCTSVSARRHRDAAPMSFSWAVALPGEERIAVSQHRNTVVPLRPCPPHGALDKIISVVGTPPLVPVAAPRVTCVLSSVPGGRHGR
jgi:hypothetical protein